MSTIAHLVQEQRRFFEKGETFSWEFRKAALGSLFKGVKRYESEILKALQEDLRKPAVEAFLGEIGILYKEIRFVEKNLHKWMSPRRVRTPTLLLPGKSLTLAEPVGLVLVIGPWNYPFQLVMTPLIGALAAGNCAVVKPSETSPHTERILQKMLSETFPAKHVSVVLGGAEISQELLKEKWNHIFFTGGASIAKLVAASAAEHLTPMTLELGGKSPCLVCKSAPIEKAAKRIVWGKFYNAGQTCVAPDYVLVPRGHRDPLLKAMAGWIGKFYGTDPKESPDYARIINDRHFDRLLGYLQQGKIFVGGESDRAQRYIAPTILFDVKKNAAVMSEEIFGPILPVLEYPDVDSVISFIQSQPKPLAFYLFTQDVRERDAVLSQVSFGGSSVNDTLVHLFNPRLPFGGVGESGYGRYHGEYSFETFSHRKSVVQRTFAFDIPLRYPPYRDALKLVRKLVDIF